MSLPIHHTIAELRSHHDALRSDGRSIGFVPTMGYLHEGHLSLIRRARAENDVVVVSIFVNPLQFAPDEDLSTYPRDLERDSELAESAGADHLFVPSVEEMYPLGPVLTSVSVPSLAAGLEGHSRPTHFDGVATVVAKLFSIVGQCRAYFGEKDFQQLAIVRRMVADLSLPVEVVACPIARDDDGLALSSRNVFLTEEERRVAPALKAALDAGAAAIVDDGLQEPAAVEAVMAAVIDAEPLAALDYVAAVDAATLERPARLSGECRLLVAAGLGTPRLIDNLAVSVPADALDATTASPAAGQQVAASPYGATRVRQWTAPSIRATKLDPEHRPLVMVTAYDSPSAKTASDAGVDLILVGDSLAMVVLGHDDTLQVTVADLAYHTAAVRRADPVPFVVGDLPWMAYHTTVEAAIENAATILRSGADAVKLEGGRRRLPMIEGILNAEIPVMGHLGLTPQSTHMMGGFKVQAKEELAARELLADSLALAEAGCFSIVFEGVPREVATWVSEQIPVPTIGIGAGPGCDGQVLVYHDVLGVQNELAPRFVRRYANIEQQSIDALRRYSADVRAHRFPGDAESYHAKAEIVQALRHDR